MREIINKLFNKNTPIYDNDLSESLFISYDKFSALRHEYNSVLKLIKLYDDVQIVKEKIKILQEEYSQGLFIIRTYDLCFFVRIIMVGKQIYDVLIYSNFDNNLIQKVFFETKEIEIPNNVLNLLNQNFACAICIMKDGKYRLLKANNCFYSIIGFEDWDFENKHENNLNAIFVDKTNYKLSSLKVIKNGGEISTVSLVEQVIDNFVILSEK